MALFNGSSGALFKVNSARVAGRLNSFNLRVLNQTLNH